MSVDPARPLRFSRWMGLESIDERRAVAFHSVTRARLELNRPLYDFLVTVDRAASLAVALDGRVVAEVEPVVGELVRRGFLYDPGRDPDDRPPWVERRLTAPTHTLFKCPRLRDGDTAPDVTVVGVPSDLGSSGIPGMHEAPAVLRQRSSDFDYRLDPADGSARGWFEVDTGRRILAGVTFGDRGDVVVNAGEGLEAVMARARGVLGDVLAAGSFPLLLGGDHPAAFPLIHLLGEREDLAVVYFDSNTDCDPAVPAGVVNRNCLGLRIAALPGVRKLVQVGHRGYTVLDKAAAAPEGVEVLSVPRLRQEGPDALERALPAGLPCHLSLSINVLDPTVAPGTSRPSPGGLNLDEAKELLRWIGHHRRVVGFDLVEVNPSRDTGFLTSITACHLLLGTLGAVFARRFTAPREQRPAAGAPLAVG